MSQIEAFDELVREEKAQVSSPVKRQSLLPPEFQQTLSALNEELKQTKKGDIGQLQQTLESFKR